MLALLDDGFLLPIGTEVLGKAKISSRTTWESNPENAVQLGCNPVEIYEGDPTCRRPGRETRGKSSTLGTLPVSPDLSLRWVSKSV